jgi:preprotein translocase subunit SecB
MRAAQISLVEYFVLDFQFKANEAFDPEKAASVIQVEDLDVKEDAKAKSENRRSWEVTLRIGLEPRPDRNFQGSFAIRLTGQIEVDQSVKDENIERLVQINGTAVVFSVAREIVRAVTSRGPFRPILLPTVTFWEPKTEATPAAPGGVVSGSVGKAEIVVDEKATEVR